MDQPIKTGEQPTAGATIAVLVCAGRGDHLWPVSRSEMPEALATVFNNRSYLQAAALRMAGDNASSLVIVGCEEHRFLILDQLVEVGLTPQHIILRRSPLDHEDAMEALASVFGNSDDLLVVQSVEAATTAGGPEPYVCTGKELAGQFEPAIDYDPGQLERDGLFVRVRSRDVDQPIAPRSARSIPDWNAVWETAPKNDEGNVVSGVTLPIETSDSLVLADHGLTVATLGVSNLVVVAMGDAVLVAPRERASEVPRVVDALISSGNSTAREPGVVHRPWGTYQTTDRDERFQTKRIVVKPGAKLSSQLHHHRSEHWVVVSGTAEVTVGERTFLLHENESTYIKAGTVHRLANPGRVPLHLVEVQCGTYLGEDDIVRFDDVYGRS